MHENPSKFQLLLNQILSKDNSITGIVGIDDQDIDDKIETAKAIAYEIHKHDPIGGKLILMSCLWVRDRLEKSNQIEQDDFYQYLQYYFQTGRTLTNKN